MAEKKDKLGASNSVLALGGRRRKTVVIRVKRTIPEIFQCPNCGIRAVKVSFKRTKASVMCGNCGLKWETTKKTIEEPVDIYNRFVDAFHSGELVIG